MKSVFQTILGLLIDDWWLGIGILVSILVTFFALHMGLSEMASGWVLTLLLVGTLLLSLTMEYRRKRHS
ncbi:hypothetical protein O9H85_07315 [Paenibacillus filicis]|uniref:Uncharacterized protein n=1 Tax=Paenibacillus gyeongsangnamensis TaxID=3388067 RepID=A0ABT4Q5T5_9BACL|nr:hypothetical protein [Paenibacillus filicis]MCZ8512239.1 hypothetical protein [Paenibacillus filicis]